MEDSRNDLDLLRSFVKGDKAALSALANRYERCLLGLSNGLLGSRPDRARDAVQNAWLSVIRAAGSFRGDSSVKTWLYRIVINESRSLLREQEIRVMNTSSDLAGMARQRAFSDDGIARALREAVLRLGGRDREMLLLCFHRGMTHKQAAEILEVPLGTLKTRIRSAIHELRSALQAEATP